MVVFPIHYSENVTSQDETTPTICSASVELVLLYLGNVRIINGGGPMRDTQMQEMIEQFSAKYLKEIPGKKDEQLLGYASLDEDSEVLVVSSFDPNYVNTGLNPLKSWIVYNDGVRVLAKLMEGPTDFKRFAVQNFKALYANN